MTVTARAMLCVCLLWAQAPAGARAVAPAAATPAAPAADACPRPDPGSVIEEPRDLRSRDGVLRVSMTIRNQRQRDGSVRYCYLLADGTQAPTLRLHPGDRLVLDLTNELTDQAPASAAAARAPRHVHPAHHHQQQHGAGDPCDNGTMSLVSTNLHFHGLTVPPVCHQDEVLKTSIQPGDPPFEYRIDIPVDEPPGLYWYHPHIHGFSKIQVSGGASGALVIEGLERATAAVAGLPERVLIVRDQDLLHPAALPSASEPVVPKMMIDRDGDAANNGTGFGKPAKDLSINFVPVPFPDYPPALLRIKPQQRELWRVLNASTVTYLNLAVLFKREPQPLAIVALDGVPLGVKRGAPEAMRIVDHYGLPPGGRVEFIVTGPPRGVPASLVTRTVDTGSGGENDPNRALAAIVGADDAAGPQSTLPAPVAPLATPVRTWLGDVAPVRVRKLYFSEKLSNPDDPNSATDFYLTVDGEQPAAFDPASTQPNIVVKQGDVEDWIVENHSTELHAFHIHQLHFLLLDWSGVPVDEPFLRDTVNVPFYNGRMLQYPSVRLRMDFRDPHTVGTFVYHCHLLEHEDGGMMGVIRVLPDRVDAASEPLTQASPD